jgi:hypothetical protein
MADQRQAARLDSRSEGPEAVPFDPFDPVALEARLAEARARRALAIANRKTANTPPQDASPSPARRAEPLPRQARPETTPPPAAPPEAVAPKSVVQLPRIVPARAHPPLPPGRPAAARPSDARPPVLQRFLPAAIFLMGPALVAGAIYLAPTSLRQDLADLIAPRTVPAQPAPAATESAPAPATTTPLARRGLPDARHDRFCQSADGRASRGRLL